MIKHTLTWLAAITATWLTSTDRQTAQELLRIVKLTHTY